MRGARCEKRRDGYDLDVDKLMLISRYMKKDAEIKRLSNLLKEGNVVKSTTE